MVSLMVLSCNTLFDNLFDEAKFKRERAAWEAQGPRHYRFATRSRDSVDSVPFSAEITVFPDREPEVVVLYRDKERNEPYYDVKTIDALYQRIADDTAALEDFTFKVWYSKRHYPILYDYYPKLPDDVPREDIFEFRISEFDEGGQTPWGRPVQT
jgi:hypothetical protein